MNDRMDGVGWIVKSSQWCVGCREL